MGGYGTARNEKQKHHLFPSAPSPHSPRFLLFSSCFCPISAICHPLAFTVHFIHSFLKDNWFSPLIPLTWRQREMRTARWLEEPHIYHSTRTQHTIHVTQNAMPHKSIQVPEKEIIFWTWSFALHCRWKGSWRSGLNAKECLTPKAQPEQFQCTNHRAHC